MSRHQYWYEIEFTTPTKDNFWAEVEVEQDGTFDIIGLKSDCNLIDYIEDSYDFFMIQLAPLVAERLAEDRMSKAEYLAEEMREGGAA